MNRPGQVLFASLIGTTIEFFDFYIYATAAVLVFPRLFFPASDPASATLASLATFAHRVSRAADRLGALRPLRRSHRPQDHAGRRAADDGDVDGGDRPAADLRVDRRRWRRCCWRCAASDRASVSAASGAARCCSPSRTRRRASARGTACFRSSARRSASSSRAASSSCCRAWLTDEQFFAFGWRIPFLASAVLVLVGLYVRLTITETPVFQATVHRQRARARCRCSSCFRDHPRRAGRSASLVSLATFVLFYLMTVFALSWGTTALGYTREQFLLIQLFGDPLLRG